jgi:hypothetical protein
VVHYSHCGAPLQGVVRHALAYEVINFQFDTTKMLNKYLKKRSFIQFKNILG